MLSSIITFLGGSAFRMVWGELSHWITERQTQAHEIERMEAQEKIDAAAHARNLEAIRLQADLGAKAIQVKAVAEQDALKLQTELDQARIDAAGFYDGAREGMKPTGVRFVDAWNGSIRPACATFAIFLWVLSVAEQNMKLTAWDCDLIAAIFGFFFASRELAKRGK